MPLHLLLALLLTPPCSPGPKHRGFSEIDPPNWYAALPAPMLLIHGENLTGSTSTLSDSALHISTQKVSVNGYWAELTLQTSPSRPEAVRITAAGPRGKTIAPFQLDQRRAADDIAAGFSSKDVMYLAMTDRFADGDPTNDGTDHAAELAKPRGWHGGDFRGMLQHLDRFQDLGVTTVWLTPVYSNVNEPDSYYGYGATDRYAVDPHFGRLADLQQMVAELHRRHIKFVLDTVPNHVGPKHPWVADEPEPDWFHDTPARHLPSSSGFAPVADPHADPQTQKAILEGWFADSLPDMNQENPTVAHYLIQNVIWWVARTGSGLTLSPMSGGLSGASSRRRSMRFTPTSRMSARCSIRTPSWSQPGPAGSRAMR